MGWVPPVAAWPLMRKTGVGVLRTSSENEVEESEGLRGIGLPTQGTREALGLTDWWCEGVGSGGQA